MKCICFDKRERERLAGYDYYDVMRTRDHHWTTILYPGVLLEHYYWTTIVTILTSDRAQDKY